MNHTEKFNAIMKASEPIKKVKQAPVKFEQVQATENMNDLQTDLSNCLICGNVLHLPKLRLINYDDLRAALLKSGAKYVKNTFVFQGDAMQYINRLMQGENINLKKEFQFFATPQKLALKMAEILDIETGNDILEPSAGQGALIDAIYRQINTTIRVNVDYYELMDINKSILGNTVFCGVTTIFKGDDFLLADTSKKYDKIIANPPFSKNQDIDHILKMYECLADNGRIVTIASNSWRTGNQKKQVSFRAFLEDVNAVIEDIKAGEFKESGTNVSTCLITIDK